MIVALAGGLTNGWRRPALRVRLSGVRSSAGIVAVATVMALSIVLRIKRTLNGAEIDELISDVQARKTRAIELARRADWHRRELSARRFAE
jgi:hypothetical protein